MRPLNGSGVIHDGSWLSADAARPPDRRDCGAPCEPGAGACEGAAGSGLTKSYGEASVGRLRETPPSRRGVEECSAPDDGLIVDGTVARHVIDVVAVTARGERPAVRRTWSAAASR